jgi:hypothetical protein
LTEFGGQSQSGRRVMLIVVSFIIRLMRRKSGGRHADVV